jgi:hypothetical protein
MSENVVVKARAALPALRHHGMPFYGKQHECAACSMGRPCSIKDLVVALVADEETQSGSPPEES